MLAFLPLLGPLLQGLLGPIIGGVTSIFGKYWDSKVALARTDADVTKTETTASVNIIKATEEDWGVRLARDVLIWPWAVWGGAIGWDSLIAKTHPTWMLHPVDIPPGATWGYMPYAVVIFLLGNIGFEIWKKR